MKIALSKGRQGGRQAVYNNKRKFSAIMTDSLKKRPLDYRQYHECQNAPLKS